MLDNCEGSAEIRHSRYVIFQMAEVAVPMAMFREILNRIQQLRFLAISSGMGIICEIAKRPA